MKLTKKLLAIAVIFTVIGFMVLPLTGCPEEDNSSSSSQTGVGGNKDTLTLDTWTDGTIDAGGEQWFNFTATAETHYIHFQPGTLNDVYVQLYEADRETTKGSRVNLYTSWSNQSWSSLTSGNVYYIKVTPYTAGNSGTYKIGVNTIPFSPILLTVTVPTTSATPLTADTWTDGSITTAGGEQWFKFTATAETHYIHFLPGTLTRVTVQLYTSDGRSTSSTLSMYTTYKVQRSLTANSEYYIKASSSSSSGTYKIAFNSTLETPVITLPTDATELTVDTWADGNFTSGDGEQWFKFKATVTNHYIYFQPGTLSEVNVQLYTSEGKSTASAVYNNNISFSPSNTAAPKSLTANSYYYIRVTGGASSGTYKIAFGTTAGSPISITVPTEGVIELTNINTWYDGSIATANDEQWFKFTATAVNHYIYFQPGTLAGVNVQLYTNDGRSIQGIASLSINPTNTSRTHLTVNSEYYIKVTPNSGSGAYKIGFGTTSTLPN